MSVTSDEKEPTATTTCRHCHQVKECIYGPDPYASEIGDDHTPVWECADCRYESAMDI